MTALRFDGSVLQIFWSLPQDRPTSRALTISRTCCQDPRPHKWKESMCTEVDLLEPRRMLIIDRKINRLSGWFQRGISLTVVAYGNRIPWQHFVGTRGRGVSANYDDVAMCAPFGQLRKRLCYINKTTLDSSKSGFLKLLAWFAVCVSPMHSITRAFAHRSKLLYFNESKLYFLI